MGSLNPKGDINGSADVVEFEASATVDAKAGYEFIEASDIFNKGDRGVIGLPL